MTSKITSSQAQATAEEKKDTLLPEQTPLQVTSQVNSQIAERTFPSIPEFPNPDYNAALSHFRLVDPALYSLIISHHSNPDNPVCPLSTRPTLDPSTLFHSLARAIVFQQLHGKAASKIWKRIVVGLLNDEVSQGDTACSVSKATEDGGDDGDNWNEKRLNEMCLIPENFLAKTEKDLLKFGLSQRKASYLYSLASHFLPSNPNRIDPQSLISLTNAEVSRTLTQIKGIGQWTVDMFLIFNLKRLDVMPIGDLGVKKGMSAFFRNPTAIDLSGARNEKRKIAIKGRGKSPRNQAKSLLMKESELVQRSEIWSPYKSIAAWFMWRIAETVTV